MADPKEMLVPVDFSETSDEALARAGQFARAFQMRVHLLHVIPDPHSEAWSIESSGMNLDGILQTWQQDARQRLDALTVPGLPAGQVTHVIEVGRPHAKILEYATAQGIDLIVMGTHGRGGIEHVLLGSVAERVVRTAPCPVMTVRPASAP